MLESVNGRIAVGWLVVEDLVVVLVLVLLPALAGSLGGTAHRAGRRQSLWTRAGAHAGQGGGVRGAHAGRRARGSFRGCSGWSRAPARASCSPWRDLRRGGRGLSLGRAVRRVVRARRVLRRDDDARVGAEPSRGRGVAAAARRVLGAVLRLGRHAVRPEIVLREPLKLLAVVAIIMVGKTLAAVGAGARLPLSAQHRADGGGEPGADRRVLLHPRRARRDRSGCCRPRDRA